MAATTDQGGGAEFARDLGYLDKFFAAIDGHAATLGGDRGARLTALIAEERNRWAEIRSLLAGEAVAPSRGPASPGAARPAAAAGPRTGAGEGFELTVGSLRRRGEAT
jgi:hypothetical protein